MPQNGSNLIYKKLVLTFLSGWLAIFGNLACVRSGEKDENVKLLFVGDVMLGRLVNNFLKRAKPETPWGNTLSIFKQADLRICNLECVLSDRGTPWMPDEKTFHFRSDPKNVEVLKAAGIECVSLANNHALDYGPNAMAQMLSVLDQAGIHHAGAGKDELGASQPAYFSVNNLKVGFISVTDNESDWEATDKKGGIHYVPIDPTDKRAKKLFDLVKETKKRVGFLIVALHWGPNWGYRPQPNHPPFAHALIDAGADLLFGHSCHVTQGIELYKGKPILYSTGDFVDDYAVDRVERNDRSFIFMVEIEKGKIHKLKLYPTTIDGFQAHLAKGEEARQIAHKMQTLCQDFKTSSQWDSKEGFLEIRLP